MWFRAIQYHINPGIQKKPHHLRYTHISYHRRGLSSIKLKGPNLRHLQNRKSGIIAILAICTGI